MQEVSLTDPSSSHHHRGVMCVLMSPPVLYCSCRIPFHSHLLSHAWTHEGTHPEVLVKHLLCQTSRALPSTLHVLGLNWAVATCRFLPVRPGQTRGCTEGRAGEGRDSGRRASQALGPSHLLRHTTCPSACSCRAQAPHRQCNDHVSQVIVYICNKQHGPHTQWLLISVAHLVVMI